MLEERKSLSFSAETLTIGKCDSTSPAAILTRGRLAITKAAMPIATISRPRPSSIKTSKVFNSILAVTLHAHAWHQEDAAAARYARMPTLGHRARHTGEHQSQERELLGTTFGHFLIVGRRPGSIHIVRALLNSSCLQSMSGNRRGQALTRGPPFRSRQCIPASLSRRGRRQARG